MKLKLLTICSVLAFGTASFAQTAKEMEAVKKVRRCGTTEHMEYLKSMDPTLEQRLKNAEILLQEAEKKSSGQRSQNQVYTIPVVVHVLWSTTAQNLSVSRIQSQIDVLNADFARMNADSNSTPVNFRDDAGRSQIQFCLAQRDPQGNATNGIVSKQTTVTSWSDNDAIKKTAQGGSDAWDVTKYFNIWVGNLGGGLLGYAEFPTSSASTTYGVVINYAYFGTTGSSAPYNKGRTATHEVGHCFNLFHIWGDDGGSCSGSDQVSDTPNQADATSSCFTFPKLDACTTTGDGIMYMNYMDYSVDNCLNMFTKGQVTRMENALNNLKASLKTSNGCVPVAVQVNDAGTLSITSPVGSMCNGTFTPTVTLKNYGSAALTSVTINYKVDNGTVNTYAWTGNLAQNATAVVTLPSVTTTGGAHTFTAYTSNPNGAADGNAGNDSQTVNFSVVTGTPVALPFTEGFEATTFPPTGWTLSNPNTNNTWSRISTEGGFGSSTSSARMDNYSGSVDISGQFDDLVTPLLDFSNALTPCSVTFDVSYARYDAQNFDSLLVHASTNCGQTWNRVYGKGGTGLATAPDNTNAFAPSNTQWRTETISLNSYAGQQKVQVRFRSRSGWGNHLYIDNVNIVAGSVGITNLSKDDVIGVYPNPTTGFLNLSMSLKETSDVEIRVYDSLGKIVATKNEGSVNKTTMSFDFTSQPSGLYFAQIRTKAGISIHKFTVNH